jgi:patatin-like phospholipase/acyl hydrolase
MPRKLLMATSGGVRGVIQLEVLKLIEMELHGKLPIQCFFDMIVGKGWIPPMDTVMHVVTTNAFLRTGGFIAAGLVSKRWSLEECSQNFQDFCIQVFSHRNLRKFPKISWRHGQYSRAKYGSRQLEERLKDFFTHNQSLFGNSVPSELMINSPRVVIPSSRSDGRIVAFTNYHRHSKSKGTRFCKRALSQSAHN